MKCLTFVLALTAAVSAAPYALRQAARPTGPPPLKAKLLAYIAGTETQFGVISANGTLLPTSAPAKPTLLPPVADAEPEFTITYTPTKRATIFAASVAGPLGVCAVGAADGLLDCTREATSEGVRVESTVYGWELDVNGDWWWYDNPPVDRAAPRAVHASYGELKGQAPFQIMLIPVGVAA